jgi:hypothetical protein
MFQDLSQTAPRRLTSGIRETRCHNRKHKEPSIRSRHSSGLASPCQEQELDSYLLIGDRPPTATLIGRLQYHSAKTLKFFSSGFHDTLVASLGYLRVHKCGFIKKERRNIFS